MQLFELLAQLDNVVVKTPKQTIAICTKDAGIKLSKLLSGRADILR